MRRRLFGWLGERYRGMSRADLDREYSPSQRVDDMDEYLQRYAELSQEARWRAQARSCAYVDLSYGIGERRKLDMFLPGDDNRRALMVYLHGGFWQMLSKADSAFAAPMFQSHGSYFVALGYTLAPDATLAEIVDDTRRALAWLYRNADEYGYDREAIFVTGSSAGAHLATVLLHSDWPAYGVPRGLIKGVCAVSGVYDLEPIRLSYVNAPLHLTEEEVESLSPARSMPSNHCPVILVHGDNETDEFKRQTSEYAERLIHAGEEVQCREITGRNHFDVILDLCDDQTWLAQAVLEQMGLAGDNEAPR